MADETGAELGGETPPGDGGDDMHIHRPKPLHGWREVLGEVGVIVVGIVIALGGEQAIEALHWAHQVETGEAALKGELAREVNNAALRAAQDDCITRRLAALASILQQSSESGRLPPVSAIGQPPYTPWTVGVWDALVASQTVSHLPRNKMIAYTRIAQVTAYLSNASDQEQDQWTTLNSVVGPGRRLSDVEAEELRKTLAKASSSNRQMRIVSERLRDQVKATGLVDQTYFAEAASRAVNGKANAVICRPTAPVVSN